MSPSTIQRCISSPIGSGLLTQWPLFESIPTFWARTKRLRLYKWPRSGDALSREQLSQPFDWIILWRSYPPLFKLLKNWKCTPCSSDWTKEIKPSSTHGGRELGAGTASESVVAHYERAELPHTLPCQKLFLMNLEEFRSSFLILQPSYRFYSIRQHVS